MGASFQLALTDPHRPNRVVPFFLGSLRLLVLSVASYDAASSRKTPIFRNYVYEKHGIVPFFLGSLRLLVLSVASYDAASSRKTPIFRNFS